MRKLAAGLLAASVCLADVASGLRAYDRKDFATAFREWSSAADRGSGDAEYHLGLLYRDGEGVSRDYGQARHWFQLSADQGYVNAANELGLLYLNGKGGAVDYPRAFSLFTKASSYSSAALYNIALMHEMGWAVAKSAVEACAWYTVAAEKGSRGAAGERDYNCRTLSAADRQMANRRISALHRQRAFTWMGTEGLYWVGIFRNLIALIVGICFLVQWALARHGWSSKHLPPEAELLYRERTRSRARGWLLWYRPCGVIAWTLHLLFHAVLAVSAIAFAALAAIPFTAGSVGLAVLLLSALAMIRAAAVWRDRRACEQPGGTAADNQQSSLMRNAKALVILLTVCCFAQTQTRIYRDPAGRYSVPVPAGWTATPNGSMLALTSGDTYALVAVIDGGGADSRRVAQFTDQFGRQWQGYQRLQSGPSKLSGISGYVALYSGKNPKGMDAMVKALSAPTGNNAYLLLFSAPVQDWQSKKAAMESIERGFSAGGGGPANPSSAQPQPPANRPAAPQLPISQTAPARNRELPAGFVISARSGPVGQALTASFNGGESARMVFRGIFKHLATYFDAPPQLRAAIADPQDRQIQGFFHASYQGTPVRGLMSLSVEAGKGYTSVLFDREDTFARSMPVLSKGMAASLPKGSPAPAGGGGGPARPLPLTRTSLLDGSGYVGLPSGWVITGSFKGVVDITGPQGQAVSLGGYQVAYSNPLPGTPATLMVGPYRGPGPALALYIDTLTQHGLRNGRGSFRVVEQQPFPDPAGSQAAYILYDLSMQGKQVRGFAYVSTKPVDNTSWFYYMSAIAAPAERFAQDFPTMWEMWKSWSVNPAVFRERMDAALQSMRETYKIIQSVHDNTQRTYDNTNAAWSQVIRGVTTIEDVVTRERADVDTNNVDFLLRRLNESGYQYRQVPLPELVQ